jgi:hypothetical protein
MKPDPGNPQLANLSPLRVREILRSQMIGDKKLRDNYYRWLKTYHEGKATHNDEVRGIIRRR